MMSTYSSDPETHGFTRCSPPSHLCPVLPAFECISRILPHMNGPANPTDSPPTSCGQYRTRRAAASTQTCCQGQTMCESLRIKREALGIGRKDLHAQRQARDCDRRRTRVLRSSSSGCVAASGCTRSALVYDSRGLEISTAKSPGRPLRLSARPRRRGPSFYKLRTALT